MPDTTDRYPVNPLDDPAQFAEKLRDFERRISQLEGKPLSGTFTSADSHGDNFVTVGALPDGDRGFLLRSEVGNWNLFRATSDDGWTSPHLQGAPYDPAASKSITSPTFVDTYGVLWGDALGAGVELMIPWATAAGTTGELQVISNSGSTTDPQTLPAASSGLAFVRWLHGETVGFGPLQIRAQARRTAGTNAVTIGPVQGWVQEPSACSTTGNWL